MKKMLLAIDGSKGALKGVKYVGEQFAGISDLRITLFHVPLGVPPELWDDGHILTEGEKAARKAVLDKWEANQKFTIEATFQAAIEILIQKGVNREQVETKTIRESMYDVAECILTEARDGGYLTLVIGRCGHSSTPHYLMGSITNSILNRGAGIAICVVE
jgi:nucleotide-binding universal stress UspA family protein